jgi:ribosomal protein S21
MTSVSKKHRKESFESMMRRFKKSYERNDTANLVRDREHYTKPSLKRHRARTVAVKIEQKRQDDQQLKRFGSR